MRKRLSGRRRKAEECFGFGVVGNVEKAVGGRHQGCSGRSPSTVFVVVVVVLVVLVVHESPRPSFFI